MCGQPRELFSRRPADGLVGGEPIDEICGGHVVAPSLDLIGVQGITGSDLIRGASPLELPYTLSRAPLRRRAPVAWLARHARSHLGTSVRFMRQLLG